MINIFNKLKKIELTPAQSISLSFLIIILLGGFVLYLPISYIPQNGISANGPSAIDCIFTAASAVCVTGQVVVDTSTTWSIFGQLWILLLIQIGGIGFVTILTAITLTIKKRVSLSSKILATESLNQNEVSNISNIIKKVSKVTFVIELIGALALAVYFIPNYGFLKGIFFSIFHSISAFCNAGFDLMGQFSGPFSSLTSFYNNAYINIVISSLIILGGIGFITISEIIDKKSLKNLSLHSKIVLSTTAFLITVGTVTIFILEFSNPNTLGRLTLSEKILTSFFQSVTTRTAGFNTIDLAAMNNATIIVFLILMMIGASPSSTGGGFKTTTFFTAILFVKSIVLNRDYNAFHKRIPDKIINKALATILVSIAGVTIFSILISIFEPNLSLEEIVFEVISALATIGLSLGVTTVLSTPSKILLIIAMFLGRVGAITVLIAISKTTKNNKIKYTEESILI